MTRLQKLAIVVVGIVILAFVMGRGPSDTPPGTSNSSSSSSITKIGQPVRVKSEAAGCFKDEDTYKIIGMAEKSDTVALQKMLASGACRALKPEWTMYVEHVGFSDNVCTRPRGWTALRLDQQGLFGARLAVARLEVQPSSKGRWCQYPAISRSD
jgi:hypothetical protein